MTDTPAEQKKVVAQVTYPHYCTEFVLPTGKDATLRVDRRGVEVSPADADRLVKTAAEYGVTVKVSDR